MIEIPGAVLMIVHGVSESMENIAGIEFDPAGIGKQNYDTGVKVKSRKNADRAAGVEIFD